MRFQLAFLFAFLLGVAGLVYAARTPLPVEQPVTCCCHTQNGICCAEQSVCGGIVIGCFCS